MPDPTTRATAAGESLTSNPAADATYVACDCPNDGENCPHCGRYPLTVRHSDRCHKAALDV